MYYFGRRRVLTLIYCCFIAVFLGSFIILTTLSTIEENSSTKDPARSKKPAKPSFIDKIRLRSRRRIAESSVNWCHPLRFIPHAETRPVTALVSFPGSGNTWLRYLIQQSTGIHTGSQYVDKTLQYKGFPAETVFDASVAVVKTHEWGPKIRERFQKAVLLIRHPKAAIQSLYNLWRGGGHTGLAPKRVYENEQGQDWRMFFNGYINDWQSTNLDWIHNFTGPLHIVLYDQLRDDLGPTLRSLVQYLDLPLDEAAIQCTIDHSEGLFHRKPRTDNFDPYTEEMKTRLAEVEEYVRIELEKYLDNKPASSNVSLFRFINTFGLKFKMGDNESVSEVPYVSKLKLHRPFTPSMV